MKKWILLGLAGVVLLWLFGAAFVLPSVQAKLEKAASQELARPEYTGAFDEVKVTFSGQDATLTGKVGSQTEHTQLTALLTESLRTPGSSLNPVESVANRVGVAYELSLLHPKPWLLVSRYSDKQGVIAGVVPSEWKEKAVKAVEGRLTGVKFIASVNTKLRSESKPRPALDAAATLDTKTLPQLADREVAVTALDGHWTTFKATSNDAEIRNAIASSNVETGDVEEALAPLRALLAAEAEKIRQTTLPPSYGAVVALPESLYIYGFAGDGDAQRGLLTALSNAYPRRKILTSAIRLSNDVRAAADWAPAVASLPKKDGEAFVAALKASSTPADRSAVFTGKGDQAAMQKALSGVLPATFDYATLWEPYGSWLKAREAPPATKTLPPAPPPTPSQPSIKVVPPPAAAPALAPPAAAPSVTPAPALAPAPVAPPAKTIPPQ